MADDHGIHPLERQRREKRDQVAALGLDPYGHRTDGIITSAEARARYDADADAAFRQDPADDRRPVVTVAGRVMLHRDNGKLIWMNLRDHTGDIQIAVSQKDCDERGFTLAKTTDMGDLVVARGPLVRTRTGEITVWASSLEPAAKCLVPPPEKWAGLSDTEIRYRQRYVDLWANPETLPIFLMRSKIVSHMRRYLEERGFVEVETPMLQALAGGAAARPFVTHMNALDINLFLRIAPELYLKRLLVAGLPRVFEINRNFRNEGLDKQHNPEFTMLELYEAFSDCTGMMDLVECLVRDVAHTAAALQGLEHARLPFGEYVVDYESSFRRVSYSELFEEALGFQMDDAERVRGAIRERGLSARIKGAAKGAGEADLARVAPVLLVNTLFEEVVEPSLDPAVPTFITHYPAAISPLTRPCHDNPAIAERADLFIGHMEIAPMYTELNDPDVQAARFREQLAGLDEEESTFRTFDADFIHALKVGMPPAGGMGLGVDRLVMLLTNQRTIRDVVLFPLLKPV